MQLHELVVEVYYTLLSLSSTLLPSLELQSSMLRLWPPTPCLLGVAIVVVVVVVVVVDALRGGGVVLVGARGTSVWL